MNYTDAQDWLLPEGIEEVLPESAKRLECVRRELLDLYRGWGYELVMPPFIEYLQTLLNNTGDDLDLQTFKLTDQLTGRMMGVRADMTPQVARIESRILKRSVPTRLCYLGTVLRTRPLEAGGSRSPMQLGAELYGHAGPHSDIEIISLMVESLHTVGVEDVLVDLGHVGIYRGLAADAGLTAEQEASLFDILQRKAMPEMQAFFDGLDIAEQARTRLVALSELNGDASVLEAARQRLQGAPQAVMDSLQTLQQVAELLAQRLPDLELHFDLAELRGYHYHTGLVFAAFSTGKGQAVAQGGRYDRTSGDGGAIRPATGFSADLKQWVGLSGNKRTAYRPAILAPWQVDAALWQKIAQLRSEGERVIQHLPDASADAAALGCDRELVLRDGQWRVVALQASA